jgi:hypothetical protein
MMNYTIPELYTSNYYKERASYEACLKKALFSCDNCSSQDNSEISDKGKEEWIWVTGYKATDKDMKCRDYQFELGKRFDMPDDAKIVLCSSGFHLCNELKNTFRYYKVEDGNRFFEVKALVRRYNKNGYYTFEHKDDKMVAKSIEFIRELTVDEIFEQLDIDDVKDWTTEQKEAARKTSISTVRRSIQVDTLVGLGYSETFATFVCRKGSYEIAYAIANAPGVSMDVKVLTIAMDMFE